ncbi:hypothetical protein [Embleya sp. NBC_00896]|uniref:hypothetical protein n=1 Tax=Embleya sp. NBC_00896 TaxID=2975961 RepID=UPI00386BE65C|nr:hypothetical protein OG928_17455 [Embleya sp. NBC_00896]
MHREQPVDAGHAHVVDPLDVGTEQARGERGLARDRRVRGARRHHAHQTARGGRRAHRDARAAVVGVRLAREGRVHRGHDGGRGPGRERGTTARFAESAKERDGLVRGLAGREDHFGVTGAQRPMGVHAREAQVGEARRRPANEMRERFVHARLAGGHTIEQFPYLGPVHSADRNPGSAGPTRVGALEGDHRQLRARGAGQGRTGG